jgi:hypothetical protein
MTSVLYTVHYSLAPGTKQKGRFKKNRSAGCFGSFRDGTKSGKVHTDALAAAAAAAGDGAGAGAVESKKKRQKSAVGEPAPPIAGPTSRGNALTLLKDQYGAPVSLFQLFQLPLPAWR